MYVVGAGLLSDFWQTHPASEGELRALHALLSSLDAGALDETLRQVASFDASGAEITLGSARVRIEISMAASVARYAAVSAVEEEAG
jgi:hypothetical protein